MFCQNCGYNLGESKFCPMCGTKVITSKPASMADIKEEPEQTLSNPTASEIPEQATVVLDEVSKHTAGNPLWRLLTKALSIIFSLLSVGLYAFSMLGFFGGGWEDALDVALVLLLPGFFCSLISGKLKNKTKKSCITFVAMIVLGIALCAISPNNESELNKDTSNMAKSSNVSITAVEEAMQTAFQDTSIAFMVTDVENGKTFLSMFNGQHLNDKVINGFADKDGNICWIEYRIQGFDSKLFDELTVNKLVTALDNYANIPTETLIDHLDVIAYCHIVGCIEADSVPSAYNLSPVLDARESEQRKGDWVYNTSMDSGAMLIRAEFSPQ